MRGKVKTVLNYIAVSAVILLILSFSVCASGEYTDDSYSLRMYESFDKLTSEMLNNEDIDDFSLSDLKDVGFTQILNYIGEKVKGEISKPVKTLTLISCVTVLFSFTDAFDDRKLSFRLNMLSPVICVYALCRALTDCISAFSRYTIALNLFLKAVCPTVCVIEAVSGRGGTALAYKLGVTAVSEILAFLCSDVVIYFIYVYFALCVCGALSPFFDLNSLSNAVMKIVSTLLGVVGAVFTGFLSVKKVFGSASDTLVLRSLKFAAGSFVPIVGSYVSEGISSVLAGVKATGSTIIVSAAAVMAVLGIPLIVRLFVWNVALRLIKGICGMFNSDSAGRIYDGFIDFIKLMTALCFFTLYICCACTLMTGLNGLNE